MKRTQSEQNQAREKKRCPKPHCGSFRVVCNGSYVTKNHGLVKRFVCRACGHAWNEAASNELSSQIGIRAPEESLYQAFALVALGLPLDQAEGLTSRKAETIRARLLRYSADPEIWRNVGSRLSQAYGISTVETKRLSAFVEEVRLGKASFHAQSRRQTAAKLKGKRQWRWRSRQPSLSLEDSRRLPIFSGQPKEEVEFLWQKIVLRGGHRPRAKHSLSKSLQKTRETMRRRIEHALGCRIVVTYRGDFYRFDDDRRVLRWIRDIRQFDADQNPRIFRFFNWFERKVYQQVLSPSPAARLLAKIEGARGRKVGSPWNEQMTPYCLAEGEMYESFIAALESVALLLRKTPKRNDETSPPTGKS